MGHLIILTVVFCLGMSAGLRVTPSRFVFDRQGSSPGLHRTLAPLRMGLLDGLMKSASADPIKALTNENEGLLKQYMSVVEKVNALEDSIEKLDNGQLRAKTEEFRKRLDSGASLDSLLVEAFAVAREAAWRVLDLRPYDVQLVGGMALHDGRLAEMATGEGKTLACVMPVYLNALAGKGAYVVTTNDYLARRDGESMGQVFRLLGLSVGVVQSHHKEAARQEAYASDVTYVSNQELGFDYLRDNLAMSQEGVVQRRPFNFCVVDEADSILVDEARTPLIISRKGAAPAQKISACSNIAKNLQRDKHYIVSEKDQRVEITKEGYKVSEQVIGKNLFDLQDSWAFFLLNAIKAKELFRKDKEYMVVDGADGGGAKVQLIDAFSGRVLEGRKFSDGLQQAIEAKEGVAVSSESQVVAKITYQNMFRLFPRLSGMTGTAMTEAGEFMQTYDLKVLPVPLALPNARRDNDDAVFRTQNGKMKALLKNVITTHEKGRPILIGTTSIQASEDIQSALTDLGLKVSVLNARPENVEKESDVVAQAGRLGAVTVATNMAGRGTDIVLGGSPKGVAKVLAKYLLLIRLGLSPPPPADMAQQAQADLQAATERALSELATGTEGAPTPSQADLLETDADVLALPPISAVATHQDLWLPQQPSPQAELALKRAVVSCLDLIEASSPSSSAADKENCRLLVEDVLARAADSAPAQSEPVRLLRQALAMLAAEFSETIKLEAAQVRRLGGLYVVGTSKHESRRIDNQLRGRSGRQGDPGSTRFFLSLEDDLFRSFGADKIAPMLEQFRVAEDMPIESDLVVQALDKVQVQVESYFAANRQQIFRLDDVMSSQREQVYRQRRDFLESTDEQAESLFRRYSLQTMDEILLAAVTMSGGKSKPTTVAAVPASAAIDAAKLVAKAVQFFPNIKLSVADIQGSASATQVLTHARLNAALDDKAALLKQASQWAFPSMARYLSLIQLDESWVKHLNRLDLLKEEMVLESFSAEQDVMITYKEKAAKAFGSILDDVRRNTVYSLFIYDPSKPRPGGR